jgi:hypothetical protein
MNKKSVWREDHSCFNDSARFVVCLSSTMLPTGKQIRVGMFSWADEFKTIFTCQVDLGSYFPQWTFTRTYSEFVEFYEKVMKDWYDDPRSGLIKEVKGKDGNDDTMEVIHRRESVEAFLKSMINEIDVLSYWPFFDFLCGDAGLIKISQNIKIIQRAFTRRYRKGRTRRLIYQTYAPEMQHFWTLLSRHGIEVLQLENNLNDRNTGSLSLSSKLEAYKHDISSCMKTKVLWIEPPVAGGRLGSAQLCIGTPDLYSQVGYAGTGEGNPDVADLHLAVELENAAQENIWGSMKPGSLARKEGWKADTSIYLADVAEIRTGLRSAGWRGVIENLTQRAKTTGTKYTESNTSTNGHGNIETSLLEKKSHQVAFDAMLTCLDKFRLHELSSDGALCFSIVSTAGTLDLRLPKQKLPPLPYSINSLPLKRQGLSRGPDIVRDWLCDALELWCTASLSSIDLDLRRKVFRRNVRPQPKGSDDIPRSVPMNNEKIQKNDAKSAKEIVRVKKLMSTGLPIEEEIYGYGDDEFDDMEGGRNSWSLGTIDTLMKTLWLCEDEMRLYIGPARPDGSGMDTSEPSNVRCLDVADIADIRPGEVKKVVEPLVTYDCLWVIPILQPSDADEIEINNKRDKANASRKRLGSAASRNSDDTSGNEKWIPTPKNIPELVPLGASKWRVIIVGSETCITLPMPSERTRNKLLSRLQLFVSAFHAEGVQTHNAANGATSRQIGRHWPWTMLRDKNFCSIASVEKYLTENRPRMWSDASDTSRDSQSLESRSYSDESDRTGSSDSLALSPKQSSKSSCNDNSNRKSYITTRESASVAVA